MELSARFYLYLVLRAAHLQGKLKLAKLFLRASKWHQLCGAALAAAVVC